MKVRKLKNSTCFASTGFSKDFGVSLGHCVENGWLSTLRNEGLNKKIVSVVKQVTEVRDTRFKKILTLT